jgi:hypothetical protein
MRPICSLSELVREIKKSSTLFINSRNLTKKNFRWQEGYGAFSYSQSSVKRVYNYVMNQKHHHGDKNFLEEYRQQLRDNEIDFDEKWLFTPLE